MMRARMCRAAAVIGLLIFSLAWVVPARADLKKAAAEKNLEKRSALALDNAADALKAARKAYQKGDNAQVAASTAEIEESIDLAYASLQETGKNPRKSNWYKKAEIAIRNLLRNMDALQREMSYTDRQALDPVRKRAQQVHDEILLGVMEGKGK